MYVFRASETDLLLALAKVNEHFAGNLILRECERKSMNRIRFRLGCKSSRAPGHTRHFHFGYAPGEIIGSRVTPNACWHAHGRFFDALFGVKPEAIVRTAHGGRITREQGNWQDRNIGSFTFPVMHSQACDCFSQKVR